MMVICLNPCQHKRVQQIFRTIFLWSWLTSGDYHWIVETVNNWWHVDSHAWYQITKILKKPHQDITQWRNWSGPQELIQPYQDVSKWVEETPIRTSSFLTVHQNTLLVWRIIHPGQWSPFLFLECSYIYFPWNLTVSGND